MTEKPAERTRLRTFGFLLGGGLAAIGLALVALGGTPHWGWQLATGVAIFSVGLMLPQILKPAFAKRIALGEFIPRVNTQLVLTLLFYIVFVPIGFVLRLVRKDLMQRHFDPKVETYRVPRAKRPASHMQRQY